MEWNSTPKNENLTIRFTKSDKSLFNQLAWTNRTNLSTWAYKFLCKHKHSYGKIEDSDQLLEGLYAIEGLEFNNKLLEDQIIRTHKST